MTKQMVSELKPGEAVQSIFAVKDRTLVDFKNKPGQYLDLQLCDASGEVQGRVWDNAEELTQLFAAGDLIEVVGKVESFQGRMQVVIRKLRRLEMDQLPLELFFPASKRDREEMLAELDSVIGGLEDEHLRGLLELIFGDAELRERFARFPGGKALHHAYIGGLIEHTLNVVRICECAAGLHLDLNRGLLVAAALLHDVGKCYELEGSHVFTYSDLGQFAGHVVITDRIVMDRLRELPEFTPLLANLLTHLLLSHHGEQEWGAPVKPAVAEAVALHHADNMDARVQGYQAERAAGALTGERWSRYHQAYGSYIYLGPTEVEPEPELEEEADRLRSADLGSEEPRGEGRLL